MERHLQILNTIGQDSPVAKAFVKRYASLEACNYDLYEHHNVFSGHLEAMKNIKTPSADAAMSLIKTLVRDLDVMCKSTAAVGVCVRESFYALQRPLCTFRPAATAAADTTDLYAVEQELRRYVRAAKLLAITCQNTNERATTLAYDSIPDFDQKVALWAIAGQVNMQSWVLEWIERHPFFHDRLKNFYENIAVAAGDQSGNASLLSPPVKIALIIVGIGLAAGLAAGICVFFAPVVAAVAAGSTIASAVMSGTAAAGAGAAIKVGAVVSAATTVLVGAGAGASYYMGKKVYARITPDYIRGIHRLQQTVHQRDGIIGAQEFIDILTGVAEYESNLTERMREFMDKDHCCVCHENLEYSQHIVSTEVCEHVFHRDCLHQLMRAGFSTCPMCNRSFTVMVTRRTELPNA
eukprot:TRINITY_DN6996_c0_g1_i1.p1 TRINITY_DN6996_c0_g1~~TRINITY_DN6996_c0_g1_i1.p1  ORF type:complete len:408 (-),score=59.58 TRINITY_DN6996_c0_g1_i1:133-1356(-)